MEGYEPKEIETEAEVSLDVVGGDFAITGINLITEASVPGIDKKECQKHAQMAKENCPVSKALAGTDITLEAMVSPEE